LDPRACAETARRRFSPTVMADGYERLYAEVVQRCANRAAPRRTIRAGGLGDQRRRRAPGRGLSDPARGGT
jgi:hypothetical protein